MRKTKKRSIFKYAYIAFVAVLAILVGLALSYVNSVIDEYESEHFNKVLNEGVELLKSEALSGELWTKEGVPSMECSKFDGLLIDQKAFFYQKLNGDVGEIKFSAGEWINDEECVYYVIHQGNETDTNIAKLTLRKKGESVQKLVVINIQKFELVSYVPLSHTYSLELPMGVELEKDVDVTVNGISLTNEDGVKTEDGSTVFTFENLYNTPIVKITDKLGNTSRVKLPDSGNGKIEYDHTFYTLTLPEGIKVAADGVEQIGEMQEDGRVLYRLRFAKKAEVTLSDAFGNSHKYIGTSSIPLTYYKLTLNDSYSVKVDNGDVPEGCVEKFENTELKNFADLVDGLPGLATYDIVVLKDDSKIEVTDKNGTPVAFNAEKHVQELPLGTVLDTVPDDVAKEVNVLKVLEDWSLFMSCDLNFNSLSKHLIRNSYQYNVAWKYNNSIDRTFTSYHGLGNPPFEQESVTNFVWLTDNCFSVDIRFVKHMIVLGERLDDEMNERCYFVKYDDTNDGRNNPAWKLVGMKEIVADAE